MLPRPRIRLPLWAALAIPGAAYVVRSVVMRDGDFSPDMPGDLIVAALLVAAILLVGRARGYAEEDAFAEQEPCASVDERADSGAEP